MILNKYGYCYCYVKLLDSNFVNNSRNTSNHIHYVFSIDFILVLLLIIIVFFGLSIFFVNDCNNICYVKRNIIYQDNRLEQSSTEIITSDLSDE
jgi:hypothetical protein